MARIAFISSMCGSPWGGSEILWSQAALNLRQAGHQVFASVKGWALSPDPIVKLRSAGIIVHERRESEPSRSRRIITSLKRRVMCEAWKSYEKEEALRNLEAFAPNVVCISQGGIADGLEWMEECLIRGISCVSVSQANAEWCWPDDVAALRLLRAHQGAAMTCFVSKANLQLFETQVASRLPNARVVWNPVQVPLDAPMDWPEDDGFWRLACVGRLAFEKGQDLIMQIMAMPKWRVRPLTVSFFGHGALMNSLGRLAAMLNVEDKVRFEGHVPDVRTVWGDHHALFLPSRCEGLPLALVEAMLCARLGIVTDVAGNREVVDDGLTGFIAEASTVSLVEQTLDRAWQSRFDWGRMGCAAAAAIRKRIPEDATGDFAQLLLSVLRVGGVGSNGK